MGGTDSKESYLEDLVVCHVGSESGDGLSARPAHAHQEGMATRLLQDARDTTHVLYGEPGGRNTTHDTHRDTTHVLYGEPGGRNTTHDTHRDTTHVLYGEPGGKDRTHDTHRDTTHVLYGEPGGKDTIHDTHRDTTHVLEIQRQAL